MMQGEKMGMEILFQYFASYRHRAADVMQVASDVGYRSLLDLLLVRLA